MTHISSYTIRKILIAVDISDCSLNALNVGACLAETWGAELHVLNAIEPSFSKHELVRTESRVNSDVIKALLYNIKRATGVAPEFIQLESNPLDAILSESIKGDFDLIIAGTHGISGVREGFMGSTAYNIVKYASCPVLTIPVRQRGAIFSRVLYPIRPVLGALNKMDIVAKFLPEPAVLDVLAIDYRAANPTSGVLEKMVDEIPPEQKPAGTEIRTGWVNGSSISESILGLAAEHNSQLIVLTAYVDAISKLNYIGPHAQQLLNLSRFPILSVKKPGIPTFI